MKSTPVSVQFIVIVCESFPIEIQELQRTELIVLAMNFNAQVEMNSSIQATSLEISLNKIECVLRMNVIK